ncbi:MAG: GNAT family N-acetyltransferase [Gaiellales bacterium]
MEHSGLRLRRYGYTTEFADATGSYLEAREAEHCLLVGLTDELRRTPRLYGFDPYLATVAQGDSTVAVALRTPPHDLLLSEVLDERAVDLVAEDVLAASPDLTGVLGPTVAARRFAELWERRSGRPQRLATALRVFQADRVRMPDGVRGRMRRPRPDERAIVIDWFDAFVEEANPGHREETPEQMVARYEGLEGDLGIRVWEDGGRAVSVAGCHGKTPHGARIGPVYTPPSLRGSGYASALTAVLTQTLLDGGCRFCFLFTDLANPTSNRIYRRLGYLPVTDLAEHRFG